jgi:hypothetical protein
MRVGGKVKDLALITAVVQSVSALVGLVTAMITGRIQQKQHPSLPQDASDKRPSPSDNGK